jgi:SAM-dependent methyltransferase
MNNRQRLIASLIQNELDTPIKKNVYLMEQVTPIYNWTKQSFNQHNILGSEYLGHEIDQGAIINGIRHEDVENLSFQNDSLDLIISNDVFEHVPNPNQAFSECVRALKPGGLMLVTIPFHDTYEKSIIRAKLTDNEIDYLLPALYHGNPVLSQGSLVFTDFGWDILEELKNSGFSKAHFDIYASLNLAHLGGGQSVLKLTK